MNIIQTKRTAVDVTTGVMSLILNQNGAAEGAGRYGAPEVRYGAPEGRYGAPEVRCGPEVRRGPAGSAPSGGETPKRPAVLPVRAAQAYATKAPRGDRDDGSLPSSPELEARDEALETETRELLVRFLQEFTGLRRPGWYQSKALSAMKRVVDGLLEKHRYAYNGMINSLSADDGGSDARLVGAVAQSLFSDGTTNWGRIASLVAFGAVVSQHMKEQGGGDCVELVGQEISTYLLTEQRDWLVKNNSWEGFADFFRVSDPESTVRNTLMACVGVAGIGATLALLIR